MQNDREKGHLSIAKKKTEYQSNSLFLLTSVGIIPFYAWRDGGHADVIFLNFKE